MNTCDSYNRCCLRRVKSAVLFVSNTNKIMQSKNNYPNSQPLRADILNGPVSVWIFPNDIRALLTNAECRATRQYVGESNHTK